jgi:two-component system, sensor histidine kinase YesM
VELAQSMEAATVPDFGKLNIQSRDEVKLLEDGYRSLMSQMKALAHREYLQEIELKDARLAALQAQINPHFLNNTLNLLGGMALAKGAQEVYKIARAVGDIFRYAVGGDGNLVTLDQEVNHVRNYLLIQEHRFAGRCELSVTSEPGALSARIPRFSLQPLVENAFEHGLQNKAGHWQLRLSCRRYRRGVLIVVRDNGVGMDRDTLVAVRNHLQDTDRSGTQGSSHIGLQNVNSRLRLHFGPRSGLRVRSTSGGGTTVAVVLPEQRGPS